MSGDHESKRPRILIAGGGIAGLEAALALTDLAGDRVHITLMAPDPDFHFKPLSVEEPFTSQPAERHELAPALADLGADFLLGALARVDAEAHTVIDGAGEAHPYDVLAVCIGGRAVDAFEGVDTFWSDRSVDVGDLIERAAASEGRELTLIVPPKTSWPLPLYELALMIRRRGEEQGRSDLRLRLVTPEEAPLGVFGTVASAAVGDLFAARRIDLELGTYVSQEPDGRLHTTPGGRTIDPALSLALPQILGPAIPGLPADDGGFIPIDEHARVEGIVDVYAAGDGTNFPVKQGGLATQQADAAAEHIAMRIGARDDARPFEPVLRGQLLTGMESLHMQHELEGGHGEGVASPDYLWWPPQKVAGRYLSAWLGHTLPTDLKPPVRPLDVEVSWPQEWHGTPVSFDAEVRSD